MTLPGIAQLASVNGCSLEFATPNDPALSPNVGHYSLKVGEVPSNPKPLPFKPTVVVIANPFGFGPAGIAFTVLEAMRKRFAANWLFLGSKACAEIGDLDGTKYIEINERDKEQIKFVLADLESPLVISSQNRFAITAASEMGVPNVLIDGLAWMWERGTVPEGLLKADRYFAMRFPGIEKICSIYPQIEVVPYIVPKREVSATQDRRGTLVHLGGVTNPFSSTLPENYLRLTAAFVDGLEDAERVTVCGGSAAVARMSELVHRSGVNFATLAKHDFDELLYTSSLFLTTPGLAAPIEAFAAGAPTEFLPPSNLSQWRQLSEFYAGGATSGATRWERLVLRDLGLENDTERTAINKFDEFAGEVLADLALRRRVLATMLDVARNGPPVDRQRQFVDDFGTDGVDVILGELKIEWNLASRTFDIDRKQTRDDHGEQHLELP